MSERFDADVAIVGAGPAGTAAAAHLGELGVRRVVLVDRHDFPRDKTCGSGISPKGIEVLKELGVWAEVEEHAYPIKGIRIVTPGGRDSWQSAGDRAQAVVCKRRVLDHVLLKKALGRGTTFLANFDAATLLTDDGRITGFRARDGREVRAKYTMVAGGSHCRLGQPEGDEARPRRIIQAIMGWWDNVPFKPYHLEMIFDRTIEPYYGWLFPESDQRVNIGITYEDSADGQKKNARDLFAQFLATHYEDRLKNATQVGAWKGHPVVWSYAIEKLTGPGRLTIGEAGLMTHPATAEGIYQGMRSGMLAAEAVADVLVGDASEERAMERYEAACKKHFQLSFWGGGVFRRLVRTPALDWMVAVTDQPLVQSATAKLMAQM